MIVFRDNEMFVEFNEINVHRNGTRVFSMPLSLYLLIVKETNSLAELRARFIEECNKEPFRLKEKQRANVARIG